MAFQYTSGTAQYTLLVDGGAGAPSFYSSLATPTFTATQGSFCSTSGGSCYVNTSGPGGGTTWTLLASGTGAVTAVSATSPLASTGGASPVISLATPVPIALGGNGTATPSIGVGTNIQTSGTWPQTVATIPSPSFSSLTLGAPLPIASGGTGTTTAGLAAGTSIALTGTWPNQTVSVVSPLPVANGGTGLTSPGLVAGTAVTISGTWPNQTINSTAVGTGGGTVTGVTGSGNIASSGGTAPAISISNAPTFSTSVNSPIFESLSGKGVLGVYNVVDFGAVGNGTTDCSTAFANAFTAAVGGGTIYIPPGVFNLSSTITSAATINLDIVGAGNGATTLLHSATGAMFSFSNAINHLNIRDFAIESTRLSTTESAAAFSFTGGVGTTTFKSVWYYGTSNATTGSCFFYVPNGQTSDSVYFYNLELVVTTTGLRIGVGSSIFVIGGRIIGLYGTYNSTGILLSGGNGGVWIYACDLESHYYGMYVSQLSGASNREVFISHASFDGCYNGLYINDASYTSIVGCWAASCDNANIFYSGVNDGAVLTISGGTIFNAGASGNHSPLNTGIYVNGYGTLLMTGVIVRNNYSSGITFANGLRGVYSVIESCQFFDNGTSSGHQVSLVGYVVFKQNYIDVSSTGSGSLVTDTPSQSENVVEGNFGYQGYNLVTPPALLASATTMTNSTGHTATVYVRGGTVQSASLNSSAIYDYGSGASANFSIRLYPRDIWSITYSVAPNIVWRYE